MDRTATGDRSWSTPVFTGNLQALTLGGRQSSPVEHGRRAANSNMKANRTETKASFTPI
jgi:hypothetical protein